MLVILRTHPAGSGMSSYMNATVSLRDNGKNIPDCPDLVFPILTYQKIGENKETEEGDSNVGDRILLPANLFFETLTFPEQRLLYEMYADAKKLIHTITMENRRDVQDQLQDKIFKTMWNLKIDQKTLAFSSGPVFSYPNEELVGNKPHHTAEKTFLEQDYKEITAIAILVKIMIPIWGELIGHLKFVQLDVRQREKFAFELIEPTLEEGAYERVYLKLSNFFRSVITDIRKNMDKNQSTNASTSFILTHSGVDDQMFEATITATIIVKRLATFDCIAVRGGGEGTPDVMVYIYDVVRRSVDASIRTMRDSMKTLPKREIASHDSEDNQSIIDHISRTSSKSIDIPILVTTAVELWEIAKLREEMEVPADLFESATTFYRANGFGVPTITQAMVASFIGTRFGGSKCINYLTPELYQQIVVILQVFLIRNDLVDLAQLASAITSLTEIEGTDSVLSMRIKSNYQTEEYAACKETFKGYLDKPLQPFTKKPGRRRSVDFDRIDFEHHIKKMIDWLTRRTHTENMAPALWDLAQRDTRPIHGTEVQFGENIIQHLCRFYLMFHEKKPGVFGLETIDA